MAKQKNSAALPRINEDWLVRNVVTGEIWHPSQSRDYFEVDHTGKPVITIGMAGVTLNVNIGDPCHGWASGDHIEPGVSLKNKDERFNNALQCFTCSGNRAVIVSAALNGAGAQKLVGKSGTVIGKHGGAERVIIHFEQGVLQNLVIGDQMQVYCHGHGLEFVDYPEVQCVNLSPELMKAWNIADSGGKLRVPVRKIVPPILIGSGVGALNFKRGDVDIQGTGEALRKQFDIEDLCLGDLVCIEDYDARFGVKYDPSWVTIGIIIHGGSLLSGHGPGTTVLFTGPRKWIEPVRSEGANIGRILKLKR
ncbi:MAG: DUF4438 domain-containing protein [Planctomycetes bacterium]|nr:DUF4438 domain-containing protein [Planctomycetota bacterium]